MVATAMLRFLECRATPLHRTRLDLMAAMVLFSLQLHPTGLGLTVLQGQLTQGALMDVLPLTLQSRSPTDLLYTLHQLSLPTLSTEATQLQRLHLLSLQATELLPLHTAMERSQPRTRTRLPLLRLDMALTADLATEQPPRGQHTTADRLATRLVTAAARTDRPPQVDSTPKSVTDTNEAV